ncbi:MAG: 30S ribosomal protein S16 [Patescibacteria group bacterium]|nr:30S ribosomal protein S16 [Patescibacteria group bacterium]MBU1952801.1 30S ribosomal protein S16 [Patescibacteria group bacterium]
MSVTIRLARIGRKNLPAYKVVVSNTRDKRNGRFVDLIGHFNPSVTPQEFKYDKEKFEKWVKNGALVTKSVQKLIDGKYEYLKYTPKQVTKKAQGGEKAETPALESKFEEKVEEKKEEIKEKTEKEPQEEAPKEEK